MKDKVLARLKAKFPGVNLSKTRLDKISDYAVKKLAAEATDDDIDEFIDGLNELQPFADIAKADDRQRLADKKAKDEADAKAKKEKADAEAAGKGSDDDDQDDTPKWAKNLIASNKTLQERLEAMEKGKTVDARTQSFLKKIEAGSDEFKERELKKFKRMNFETDEDFNEYLEDTETELATSKQAEVNSAVDSTGKVVRGTKVIPGDKKPASKEEVASVVSQIM